MGRRSRSRSRDKKRRKRSRSRGRDRKRRRSRSRGRDRRRRSRSRGRGGRDRGRGGGGRDSNDPREIARRLNPNVRPEEWDTSQIGTEPQGAPYTIGGDYFPGYYPRNYNPSTYKGPPGTWKLCKYCNNVRARKDFSKRQWKATLQSNVKSTGKCLMCVDNTVEQELTNPREFNAARRREAPPVNREDQRALEAIDAEAEKEKDHIDGNRVLLVDPDSGTTVITKDDGEFTHEDLAEILIRAGPKAEIETEKFTRKRLNTYYCKTTNMEVHANAWSKHVLTRRRFHLRRQIQDKRRARKAEATARAPAGAPPIEPIPREDINKMTEQEFEMAMTNQKLLFSEFCLICNNRVLQSIWVTHCVGKNHKFKFTQRPMRIARR